MMRTIVPLAGPDFELPGGGTRAERIVEGQPLLRRALETRSWWRSGVVRPRDMVFVLRNTPASRRFASDCLASWYPGATTVFLSAFTGGAAMTVVAGAALADRSRPICVDLADILFDDCFDPVACFENPRIGGALLTFPSRDPVYSYADLGAGGDVVRTAEKHVISPHASAGTYFFRDAGVLLAAAAHSLAARETLAFNGLLFVCPMLNGVIDAGLQVIAAPVKNIRDVKVMTRA